MVVINISIMHSKHDDKSKNVLLGFGTPQTSGCGRGLCVFRCLVSTVEGVPV